MAVSTKTIETNLIKAFKEEKLLDRNEWGIRFRFPVMPVKKIAYATNFTTETIKEAKKQGAEMLITHHGYGPIEEDFGYGEKLNRLLDEYQINHAYFHLPLDDADFGTNLSLARALGLKIIKQIAPIDNFLCGVVGELEEAVELADFKKNAEEVFGEKIRTYKNNRLMVKRVGIIAGSGKNSRDIIHAVEENCDTYITGEYGARSQIFCNFKEINLMVASHTRCEILGVAALVEKVTKNINVEVIRLDESNY